MKELCGQTEADVGECEGEDGYGGGVFGLYY